MLIRDLLEKPFGPYLDTVVLSEECKRVGRTTVPVRDFRMERGGKPIGFDETEFPTTERTAVHRVLYRGVLTVPTLDWLTPRGRALVQTELRERDIAVRARDDVVATSGLTLARLYEGHVFLGKGKKRDRDREGRRWASRDMDEEEEERPRVKIIVQGEKSLFANFLFSEVLPNGLLVTTKDRNRQFEIRSLHVRTASLSQLFLGRYRILRLLTDTVAHDPSPPPLPSRRPRYFIQRFLAHHANGPSPIARHMRALFDSDDSDTDEHGRTTRPRAPPRHVSRAEATRILFEHAAWVLADQLGKREAARVVDVASWKTWCLEMRAAERERRRQRREEEEESGESDMDVDEGDNLFMGIVIPGKDMRNIWKAAQNLGKKPQTTRRIISPSPDPDDTSYAAPEPIYDSDFSVESSPPASPSPSDFSSDERSVPLDPELLARIPRALFDSPRPLASSSGRWVCPIKACRYVIDVMKVKEENFRGLTKEDAGMLRNRAWSRLGEQRMVIAFERMVSVHYEEDHLRPQDIQIINRSKDETSVRWIHPRRHQPPALAKAPRRHFRSPTKVRPIPRTHEPHVSDDSVGVKEEIEVEEMML